VGELLHTPGSTLTLPKVYHRRANFEGYSRDGGTARATELRDYTNESEWLTSEPFSCDRVSLVMAEDLVPDLLARVSKELEREFKALPMFEPVRPSDGDALAITTPIFIRCTPGKC
jgi:hypothetical protein